MEAGEWIDEGAAADALEAMQNCRIRYAGIIGPLQVYRDSVPVIETQGEEAGEENHGT